MADRTQGREGIYPRAAEGTEGKAGGACGKKCKARPGKRPGANCARRGAYGRCGAADRTAAGFTDARPDGGVRYFQHQRL